MTTNPEVLRLAREIANQTVPEDSEGANYKREWYVARDAAITAIEKTTQLAYKFHENCGQLCPQCLEGLERYDHLRQSEKDNRDAS